MTSKEVKSYCCEDISKIENYDLAIADKTQTWHCHHKMELISTGAVVDSTKQDLIDWGIYYKRPADELIFLTSAEHLGLHKKGRTAWNKGISFRKGKKVSDETRRKMSEASKGKPKVKGKHWFNNGLTETEAFECPEGFVPGRITKGNKGTTGKKWFNNGKVNKMAETCPEGFVPGKMNFKKGSKY